LLHAAAGAAPSAPAASQAWIASIAASRQEKADEVVKEYLQRQAENLDRSKL
jgi:hypothetical protein